MKKSLFFGIIVLMAGISCEKIDDDIFFKIGNGNEFKFREIELYDTSTHILYFKNTHNEFTEILDVTFLILADGEPVYDGLFLPGYSSSIPNGPFIMSPSMYGDYALRIENGHSDKPDIRNDSRIINILSKHNLLHPGLAISSSSIEKTPTQLTFRFTVTNQDQSDLMIIDPDKTGTNLFHYFTNGLYLYDLAHNEVFSGNVPNQPPDPSNSWKTEWLSVLKSGDSKTFTLIYTLDNPLNPGAYDATFEFPGLAYQVTKGQLYQGNIRIWLGSISHNKRIAIL